jgi:predicted RNase H-like nuclease (RuvC/YqgF family)
MNMSEDRLNRIETKLDKLTDIVASIARVEEKMVANNRRVENLEHRVEVTEEEVDELKETVRDNQGVAKFADKLFWIIVGGIVSFSVWVMKTGMSG